MIWNSFFINASVLFMSVMFLSAMGCPVSRDEFHGQRATSSGSGGTGGDTCANATMCNDDKNCTDDGCTDGRCVYVNKSDFIPDDGNDCTSDFCEDGKENHLPKDGAKCGKNMLLKCEQDLCKGCDVDFDCGATNECRTSVCNPDHTCAITFVLKGTMIKSLDLNPGDCKGIVCDGFGSPIQANDDGDVPSGGQPECTMNVCMDGELEHPLLPAGSDCPGGVTYCNSNGKCVHCTAGKGCKQGEFCFQEKECFSCDDGVQNGDEVGPDCGGTCLRCDGQICNIDGECKNNYCQGTCISCLDKITNGSETDKDCGGSCIGCINGKMCNEKEDCDSVHCAPENVCCNNDCEGECKSCDTGTCGFVTQYMTDETCSMNQHVCDGFGNCKFASPHICKINQFQCASNFCLPIDGGGNGLCKNNINDPCVSDGDCITNHCVGSRVDNKKCIKCGLSSPCVPNGEVCEVGGVDAGTCKISVGQPCSYTFQCVVGTCMGNPKKCQ